MFKEIIKEFKMENNLQDSDKQLISFLHNLADSIEKKQLVPRQLKVIVEFFMNYQFQDEKNKDDECMCEEDEEFDSKELMKFLILGWWIYAHILKEKKTIPTY